MGIAPLKNDQVATLVKGDNHDCFVKVVPVSDCSIRVSRSLLQMGTLDTLSMNPTTPMCLLK